MQMVLAILVFLVGLVLIVKGGDAFVDAATWMAEVSGIPPFIIGATVVSMATTLPEMLVSAFAAAGGSVDMAVGNAVGSVTANTALILAVALLAMPGPAERGSYLIKSCLLLAALSILTVFSRGGRLAPLGSVLLMLVLAAFLWENIRVGRIAMADETTVRAKADAPGVRRNLLLFVFGAVGIVVGAQLLVKSATEIATILGVPDIVIAVTIVAVGTSLPELVTTITAIVKHQASLSAGNVIGANIIDTSLILPVCSLISGQALPINAQSMNLDIPVSLLAAAVALVPPMFTQKFSRWQGAVLLGIYAGYLALVVL